jgi:transposase
MYDAYQQRIVECDQALQDHLKGFADRSTDTPAGDESPTIPRAQRRAGPKRRKAGSHAPQFDLGGELHRISGVDLTRIDGIDVGMAQTLISEVGLDMARWPDEHHFASWLGLCPDNRITGGKVIRRGTRHVINRAATALRIAATTLLRSQSYLGGQYRRLRGKLGAPKAITAMGPQARRLGLPHASLGPRVCRQGDAVLRRTSPRAADSLAQKARRDTRTDGRLNAARLLIRTGFLERRKKKR